ncbi:vitelline membrane outer layer protein 1-like [Podarcis muralis]
MALFIGTALFLIFSSCLSDEQLRKANKEISVPNGSPWGEWGTIEFCRQGHAKGFRLKVQQWTPESPFRDDTSLNGIRLICTDGSEIQSAVGPYGTWTKAEICPGGRLISYSLRVLGYQNIMDDTAADNIRFSCENGGVLTGYSTDWGTYGPWSQQCTNGAICGMVTRIDRGYEDNTGLNDVIFYCCD